MIYLGLEDVFYVGGRYNGYYGRVPTDVDSCIINYGDTGGLYAVYERTSEVREGGYTVFKWHVPKYLYAHFQRPETATDNLDEENF